MSDFLEQRKKIQQENGEIIMQALRRLEEPCTFTTIVNYVAQMQDLTPSSIKESVKEVLQRGVDFGFVQKVGGRYTLDAETLLGSEVDELEIVQIEEPKRNKSPKRSKSFSDRGKR